MREKCGLTAAVMPALSRTELVASLRDRRTYATTGARILLDFSVSGLAMGEQGNVEEVEVKATVHACEGIECVEVVRNGEVVHTQPVGRLDMTLTWCDPEPTTGRSWYYVKVTQTDGERAWSSPVWVTRS